MRILAFPGRLNTKAKAPVRDWSTQEIADFYRAHRLLADNGAGIGIDRGVSDEGEPWMVFFDTASHDVFLHIARIDDRCHLICEPFGLRLEAADITALIAQFEHAVREQLAIRTERGKNVVIHPAARIIMSISAVFLLFKLENGEAYAKGLGEKAGGLAATEKSAGPLARAQSAFQRAFDAADAPVAAAILAGIILAGELALSPLRAGHGEAEVEKLVAMALVEHEPVVAKADGAGIEAVVAEAIHHDVPPAAVDVPLPVLVTAVPVLADLPATLQFTPPDTVVQLAAAGAAPADFRTTQFIPVAVEAPAKVPAGEGRVIADLQGDAAKAIDFLFTVSTGKFRPEEPAPAEEPVPAIAKAKLGEVTVANVDALDGQLAFSAHIDISIVDLLSLFRYLDRTMPGYDFGFDKGKTLVEQTGLTGLDMTDVASVTSTLGDGSTYTVIGRADIVDGIVSLFG